MIIKVKIIIVIEVDFDKLKFTELKVIINLIFLYTQHMIKLVVLSLSLHDPYSIWRTNVPLLSALRNSFLYLLILTRSIGTPSPKDSACLSLASLSSSRSTSRSLLLVTFLLNAVDIPGWVLLIWPPSAWPCVKTSPQVLHTYFFSALSISSKTA